jgi:serine/threonine protein kinase
MLLFKTSDGRILEFEDAPLGQGGEGAVYKQFDKLGHGDVGDLAKIFDFDKRETRRVVKEDKLKAMTGIKSPQPSYSYAWPKDLLYDTQTGEFCGYVMYLKDNKIELGDVCGYNSSYRTDKDWRFFVNLAKNLAQAVQGVHDIYQVIGDLNDKNVLIDTNTCEVTLIDTDSFHITVGGKGANAITHRCAVGKSEFVPQEVQNVKFATCDLPTFSEYTDNFSLAIIIFKLLMNGTHPFNSVGIDENSIEDNIKFGMTPYFSKTKVDKSKIAFYAPSVDMLPPGLKELFRKTFIDGAQVPEKRATASEFFDELTNLLKPESVKACFDEHWHMYPVSAAACPWCAVEKKKLEQIEKIAALSVETSNVVPDYSVARYNPVENYMKAVNEAKTAGTPPPVPVPQPVKSPEKPIKPAKPSKPKPVVVDVNKSPKFDVTVIKSKLLSNKKILAGVGGGIAAVIILLVVILSPGRENIDVYNPQRTTVAGYTDSSTSEPPPVTTETVAPSCRFCGESDCGCIILDYSFRGLNDAALNDLLAEIPQEVVSLNLSGNQIVNINDLAESLSWFYKLKELDIRGNPLFSAAQVTILQAMMPNDGVVLFGEIVVVTAPPSTDPGTPPTNVTPPPPTTQGNVTAASATTVPPTVTGGQPPATTTARTNPPVTTTRPASTAPPITTTPAVTTPAPVTSVILDMQTVPNFANLQNGNITFLSRSMSRDTVLTVNASAPRTVTVTNRGGTSQGIRIIVEDIARIAQPGRRYRIEFEGRFPNDPNATARIRRETGSAATAADTLITAPALNGTFFVGVTRTYEQIIADRGIFYSLGNVTGNIDIVYTQIRIIEIQ